jgi:hypothetical protein
MTPTNSIRLSLPRGLLTAITSLSSRERRRRAIMSERSTRESSYATSSSDLANDQAEMPDDPEHLA